MDSLENSKWSRQKAQDSILQLIRTGLLKSWLPMGTSSTMFPEVHSVLSCGHKGRCCNEDSVSFEQLVSFFRALFSRVHHLGRDISSTLRVNISNRTKIVWCHQCFEILETKVYSLIIGYTMRARDTFLKCPAKESWVCRAEKSSLVARLSGTSMFSLSANNWPRLKLLFLLIG